MTVIVTFLVLLQACLSAVESCYAYAPTGMQRTLQHMVPNASDIT